MHRCVGSLGDGIVMVKGFRIYAEYFFSFIIFSTFLTFFVNVKKQVPVQNHLM